MRVIAGVIIGTRRNHAAIDIADRSASVFQNTHQHRAIGMKLQAQRIIDKIIVGARTEQGEIGGIEPRHHVAGYAHLAVTRRGHRAIILPARTANQHVGAGNIGAAGQIETNERHLAAIRAKLATDIFRQQVDIFAQRAIRLIGRGKKAEHAAAQHGR